MYRRFNLRYFGIKDKKSQDLYYKMGIKLFNDNKTKVEKTLKGFILTDGSLDGSKMQDNWFPQIDADIFISHSHDDEDMALILAGWLYDNFKIKTFIDSCIWGYADDLIRIIDNRYCLNSNGETYNYQKRNYSTSHIHMMLSTALSMMIDKTECLFFLNTPSSIKSSEVVTKTESPWIYSEISMSELIRKKTLKSYRNFVMEKALHDEVRHFNLSVEYTVYLEGLTSIKPSDLDVWYKVWQIEKQKISQTKKFPLDILYQYNP